MLLLLADQFGRFVSRDAAADAEQNIAIEKVCHLPTQAGKIAEVERYHCAVPFDTGAQLLMEEPIEAIGRYAGRGSAQQAFGTRRGGIVR